MSRLVVASLIAAGAVLAACTPTYVAPRDGPRAQISLTRGGMTDADHAKLMVSDAQWSRRADITGGLLFTYDRPAAIPAGEPLYMELQTLRYAGATELYCGSHFVFTPTAGRSYIAAPNEAGSRCSVTLTDSATGQVPVSFRELPVGPDWVPAD